MAESKEKREEEKNMRSELLTQLLNLVTSGFGLVAALAWNEAIQTVVKEYIKPFVPSSFGIISLFLYAALVTALAVTLTYQLSKLSARFSSSKTN